jgi:hypothetical protein
MNGRITLPGDVPGLLGHGSPIVWDAAEVAGLVLDNGDESAAVAWTDGGISAVEDDVPLTELQLDLSDEAGVDRAARWLAEQFAAGRRSEGRHWSAVWRRSFDVLGWCLTIVRSDGPSITISFSAAERRDVTPVPALASIDLADPQADLLALRAACLHVAGRPA